VEILQGTTKIRIQEVALIYACDPKLEKEVVNVKRC
jgi:uncharacterized protein (DUF302 family)